MTMPVVPHILFAAAELTPIAKVGGIGDVVGALPIALRAIGFDVRTILPRYEAIDLISLKARAISRFHVTVAEGTFPVTAWEGTLPDSGVTVYLLENDEFLSRGPIYFEQSASEGSFAEFRRFLFYDLAVAEFLKAKLWTPDVLHCHDWQTGLLVALLRGKLPTLLTLHNVAMQGKWSAGDIETFANVTETECPALKLRDPNGDLNLLALGIDQADALTTVSPSYAQEILSPEYGMGLQDLLRHHRRKLSGILNGIDTSRFNPATDPAIVPYRTDNLEPKRENRRRLLERFNLTDRGPIYGFIGRLTDQKGIDLVSAAKDFFRNTQAALVILGKGLAEHERLATQLQQDLPGQCVAVIGFDAKLAQEIYAGSDYFLMPSRFEPCGLGQLVALRYGTPPIVRATGGLRDTVRDAAQADGTGFVFNDFTPEGLRSALERSADLFRNLTAYRRLQTQAMEEDFSWNASAKQYANLYRRLLRTSAPA